MTTKELAAKFNVRKETVTHSMNVFGHYKGYEPVGSENRKGTGKRQYTWEYVGGGEK